MAVKELGSLPEICLQAALTRTDVVVQPRQSNRWGALSLDHAHEFVGGMSLAVRNVTVQRSRCLPERLPQTIATCVAKRSQSRLSV
ncbi:MAG: cobaltochelatase subunit CobN [Parabacteroides distasonis]